MALSDDLRRAAEAAVRFADPDEELTGIIAAEPATGLRLYLCAYTVDAERRWLVLDDDGRPVESRVLVRDAISIAALCELAEETAGGGQLDDLAAELASLRITEAPVGIEEAQEAVRALERTIGNGPQLAAPDRLDDVGRATRRLEQALGEGGGSPFAEAMKGAIASVEALAADVERHYKRDLG